MEPVRLRSVALPIEHGGWGMLGEPLLLGLLVSPSWPGLGVGMAATFAFLARHPLKLALADRRAHRRNARTVAAERFALGYASLAAVGLALASRGASLWWMPMAAAAPLALVQLHHDARGRGRELLPELLGGIALGSIAAAELRAAGWDPVPAFAAWALLAAKASGAILYVRARLRRDRGLAFSRPCVAAAHALGVLAAAALASLGLAPWPVILAFGVLLVRSVHGLSPVRRPTRPQLVGVLEVAYGLGFLLLAVVGYRADS
jgi:YwiC-like protein